MKIKKVLAVMLSFIMLVYTASDIAYAADSDLQDRNAEVTVNTDEEINGADEETVIPLLSSEEPVDGASDEMRFIADIAMESYGWSSNGDMEDHKYKRIERNANLAGDEGTMGNYVFLGVKDIPANMFNDYTSQLITGLLVYKTNKKPEKLENIDWQGKTYKPVLKWFDVSNGDLNQGADGPYLYLYYTNEGVTEGDPVLTGMKIDRMDNLSDSEKKDIIRDMNNPEEYQDINEETKGVACYLVASYHHHTPMQYDDIYHWWDCEDCSFCTEKEKHDLCYEPSTGSDGTHRVYCTDKSCDYDVNLPHVDKDGDGICDDCNAGCVAMVNGQSFSSFEGAWRHASFMEQDATITLCEDTYASEDGNSLYMSSGNTITIEGDGHTLKICGNRPFNVRRGKLVIDADISIESDRLEYVIQATGKDSEVDFKSGSIKYIANRGSEDCVVIYAEEGAKIEFMSNEDFDIQGAGLIGYGVLVKNSNAEINLNKLNINGTDNAVVIDNSENVTINGGTYRGSIHALRLMNDSKVEINDGIFTSDVYALKATNGTDLKVTGGIFRASRSSGCSIAVKNGNVKDMLPAGYSFIKEETGALLYIEDGRMSIKDNVSVAEYEEKSQAGDVKKSIRDAKVSGIVNKTYSGKKRIQTPEIILDGKTLVKGTDYTLSYKNNLNVGKATVTIKGIGDYEGSVTKTYRINPKGTYIKKLTGSKKAITVRWNKRSLKMSKGRITGYQIQYSTSKKMTNAKKKTVKGYSNTSRKISKLKAKKRYYVRVRTYKVVSGTYYYSGWSKVKSVKTK